MKGWILNSSPTNGGPLRKTVASADAGSIVCLSSRLLYPEGVRRKATTETTADSDRRAFSQSDLCILARDSNHRILSFQLPLTTCTPPGNVRIAARLMPWNNPASPFDGPGHSAIFLGKPTDSHRIPPRCATSSGRDTFRHPIFRILCPTWQTSSFPFSCLPAEVGTSEA